MTVVKLRDVDIDGWLGVEKVVEGDIVWEPANARQTQWQFVAAVKDWQTTWTLHGFWSHEGRRKLSFSIVDSTQRGIDARLYSLDIGRPHGTLTDVHKHRADGRHYTPDDITAHATEIAKAWAEFCAEANIRHDGQMVDVPTVMGKLAS